MATPLYFPNPIAAMGQPQIAEPPQSNTGVTAMAAALEGFTSVANNFRQKEMNVQKASQMADALEREGLSQEANLYREAAKSYQIDFFATPQENERFNQSLLNDTLKLLTSKQEREMKAQQLELETQYKQAAIANQQAETSRMGRRLELDELQASNEQLRLQDLAEERRLSRGAREENAQSLIKQRELSAIETLNKNNREVLENTRKEYSNLTKQYQSGRVSRSDFERLAGEYVDEINRLTKRDAELQQQAVDKSGVKGNISYRQEEINVPKTDAELNEERDAKALTRFDEDSRIRRLVIDGATYEKLDDGYTIVTETTNAFGETSTRKVRGEKNRNNSQSTGTGRGSAPNSPRFGPNENTGQPRVGGPL